MHYDKDTYTDTDLHFQDSKADMCKNVILVLFLDYYSTYYFLLF